MYSVRPLEEPSLCTRLGDHNWTLTRAQVCGIATHIYDGAFPHTGSRTVLLLASPHGTTKWGFLRLLVSKHVQPSGAHGVICKPVLLFLHVSGIMLNHIIAILTLLPAALDCFSQTRRFRSQSSLTVPLTHPLLCSLASHVPNSNLYLIILL